MKSKFCIFLAQIIIDNKHESEMSSFIALFLSLNYFLNFILNNSNFGIE